MMTPLALFRYCNPIEHIWRIMKDMLDDILLVVLHPRPFRKNDSLGQSNSGPSRWSLHWAISLNFMLRNLMFQYNQYISNADPCGPVTYCQRLIYMYMTKQLNTHTQGCIYRSDPWCCENARTSRRSPKF